MQIVQVGSGAVHRAPVEGGPKVQVLIGEGEAQDAKGTNLSAARVSVPPGGGMSEHEHGESETALVVQAGRITVHSGEQQEKLEAGAVALIGVGERVRLENPSSGEPASLLVFFAPPGFVQTFASWPVEEDVQEGTF